MLLPSVLQEPRCIKSCQHLHVSHIRNMFQNCVRCRAEHNAVLSSVLHMLYDESFTIMSHSNCYIYSFITGKNAILTLLRYHFQHCCARCLIRLSRCKPLYNASVLLMLVRSPETPTKSLPSQTRRFPARSLYIG